MGKIKMKFFVATKNAHKLEEFSKIFEGSGILLCGEKDLEIPLPEADETGSTFRDNALIKAREGCRFTGLPSIADDSGLCVDYLNGAPGIYSARYAGEHGDDNANNQKLLKELENVPSSKRTARFVSAIACVFPDGREFTVEGTVEGIIDTKLNGNGGFGYDPLFVTEYGCFGVIPPEVKNAVSHRARAIAKFKEEIKKYI